jgi:uncharacterized membrane protein YbaN (DUF454 family)
MRKPLMILAIVGCLVMTVVGGLLPFLQGWLFFVLGLYLFATEFETGRDLVKRARGRWPWLNKWIEKTRDHKWAPRQFKEFEDITDPRR